VKAIAADEDYITQCRAQGIYPAEYYPHNIHFLNAALAMDGEGKEALAAARKVATQHEHDTMQTAGGGFAQLIKAIPMLTLVRFGQWDQVLLEPEPPPTEIFNRAMYHFGRGFAFSATANPQSKGAEARAELASLKEFAADASLARLKIFDLNSLDKLAAIATNMLEGELARRAKQYGPAVASFKSAIEMEERLLYSEPPDWMLPPRQYLGEALLAAGQATEAEAVYREDLKRHRNNGWSLFGLEQALRKQGRGQDADQAKTQFAIAWARSDVVLPASRF
jgi:hypothetical protein